MRNNLQLKIGIIGNGGQSKKVQEIFKKKKIPFFLYAPKKKKYFDFHRYKTLEKCNAIFILTPNKSHYYYLKKLYKKRYIFCEKPPVNNLKDLKKLKKIKSKKIYFNYNFRFLKICEVLLNRNKFKLGELIYSNLISAHGLAFKKEYKHNWRSNKIKNPLGVFENVSIHLIDLINYCFKIKKIFKPKLTNLSKVGNSYDTSHAEILLKKGGLVNIFTTYASPYAKSNFFLFKNGIIEQKKNVIEIFGPALNFNKKGRFVKPKIIKKINLNLQDDIDQSSKKSIFFFLNTVKKKQGFPKYLKQIALKSNELNLKYLK